MPKASNISLLTGKGICLRGKGDDIKICSVQYILRISRHWLDGCMGLKSSNFNSGIILSAIQNYIF